MVAGYLNCVEICKVQVPVAAVGGQELGSVGVCWNLLGVSWDLVGSVWMCLHAAEHRHSCGCRAEGGQPWLPSGAAWFWEGGAGRCGSGWMMELAPGQDCPAELGKSEALL